MVEQDPLKYRCDFCQAEIDDPCTTASGRVRKTPHYWRLEMVMAAQRNAERRAMNRHLNQSYAVEADKRAEMRAGLASMIASAMRGLKSSMVHSLDIIEFLQHEDVEGIPKVLDPDERKIIGECLTSASVVMRSAMVDLETMWFTMPEYRKEPEEKGVVD